MSNLILSVLQLEIERGFVIMYYNKSLRALIKLYQEQYRLKTLLR